VLLLYNDVFKHLSNRRTPTRPLTYRRRHTYMYNVRIRNRDGNATSTRGNKKNETKKIYSVLHNNSHDSIHICARACRHRTMWIRRITHVVTNRLIIGCCYPVHRFVSRNKHVSIDGTRTRGVPRSVERRNVLDTETREYRRARAPAFRTYCWRCSHVDVRIARAKRFYTDEKNTDDDWKYRDIMN